MVDIFDSPSFSSSNPFGDLIKNDNNEESYFHSDDSIFENQSFDYENNKIQKPLFPIKIPLNEQITRSSEKNVLNNLNQTPYKNQEEIKNVKEIAKDILLSQIQSSWYQLENNLDMYVENPDELNSEDIYAITQYLDVFGEKMAKAIKKDYYSNNKN